MDKCGLIAGLGVLGFTPPHPEISDPAWLGAIRLGRPRVLRHLTGTDQEATSTSIANSSTTRAELAAYPGGIVDRVVTLRNGDYEVHNISVNWPHHIFVSQKFKVIAAD